MTQTISRQQILARLDAGDPTTLVEALPPKYHRQGHLPGALNIPHDQVAELAPVMLTDKQAFIVVYCASTECRNSAIAVEALEQAGYGRVFEYTEGKKDWQAAGLPLERDAVSAAS